jgi:hypothetical protein
MSAPLVGRDKEAKRLPSFVFSTKPWSCHMQAEFTLFAKGCILFRSDPN